MSATVSFDDEVLSELSALRRFAQGLTRDLQNSSDLVQETVLRAYRYSHTYNPGSNCRAWLFQICKNTYVNEYRRKQNGPVASDFVDDGVDEPDTAASYSASLQDDVDLQKHNGWLSDDVVTALHRLPGDYQTAIILCDLEDHTYEEIAQIMHAPVGTIRSRIHRGRKLLAASLANYAQAAGLVRGASSRPCPSYHTMEGYR